MFASFTIDNLYILVPKRRARYRYPRLFLTMYVFFCEFLGPRKGGVGTDTLHGSRKCALFLRFRCLRFASDVASAESHRALGPFSILKCFFVFHNFFASFIIDNLNFGGSAAFASRTMLRAPNLTVLWVRSQF